MRIHSQGQIVWTADVIRGKPRSEKTRIPAGLILGYPAAGSSTEDIFAEFPDLAAHDIAACLDFARNLADFEATA